MNYVDTLSAKILWAVLCIEPSELSEAWALWSLSKWKARGKIQRLWCQGYSYDARGWLRGSRETEGRKKWDTHQAALAKYNRDLAEYEKQQSGDNEGVPEKQKRVACEAAVVDILRTWSTNQ